MPCDTITTQSVNLKNAMSDIVEKALKALKWNVTLVNKAKITAQSNNDTLTWLKGRGIRISSSNSSQHLQNITKEYSKQAVSWAASRAGWNVNSTGTNKLTISRR